MNRSISKLNLGKRDTRIPRKPFLWLTAALVFTVPPMLSTLALWVPLLFLAVLMAKFWMEPRDYRLRSTIWKMVLGAVVVAAVFVTYGSIEGIEPGVSVVVILMSLKILEAHTAREFQVMVNVGWILCLCGFFLSQDLAIALCALIAFTLLLVSLVEFHSGGAPTRIWPALRTGLKMLAQAAPLIVVFFILFPRVNIGIHLQLPSSKTAAGGFSGELSPGTVASLANSSAVAFRAEFPDGRIPRQQQLCSLGLRKWSRLAPCSASAGGPPASQQTITRQLWFSTMDHARAARQSVDVCAGLAWRRAGRRNRSSRTLFMERSTDSQRAQV